METLTRTVLDAIKNSPNGIMTLDIFESLKICNDSTLKTTLSRLSKSGKIIRLKRGTYSTNPLIDAFTSAQYIFNGYVGFSSALYLHRLITEIPFSIAVVTRFKSGTRTIGQYEFRAVALKDKAVGFSDIDGIVISTRSKTLFDCLYLERYSIERDKLIEVYRSARLSSKELTEFNSYVTRFIPPDKRQKFEDVITLITKGVMYGT